jgi:hypothetical protein
MTHVVRNQALYPHFYTDPLTICGEQVAIEP